MTARSIGLLMGVLLAGAAILDGPPGAFAQAPLTCSPQNVGQQVCQAEGICQCSYFAGGLLFRDPPGYRWDCSLTRGTCLGDEDIPVLSRAVVPVPMVSGGHTAAQPARDTVRLAQSALKRQGFDPGEIDGVLGPRTRAALAAFQRAQRLPPSGALTQETLSRLRLG